ncbi:MAG: hypothetical protein IH895_09590 [Planctomycetes bacterium]|nr:hypothetical protein [Planctomycetota bacterium]
MPSYVILRLLLASILVAQVPAGKAKSANPADDDQLQSMLAAARNSGLPHLMLLADQIGWMIEDGKFGDPADFKIGVQATLRYSDFSTDLVLGELYLRMLQQPAMDDLLDGYAVAGRILVDGVARDWPRDIIVKMPRKSGKSGKGQSGDDPLIKGFGAIRGADSLFVIFRTSKKIDFASKVIFAVEISRQTDHYAETAFKVSLLRHQIRILNSAGDEVAMAADDPVVYKIKPRVLEMRIPLANLEKDLRSIAVRGSVTEPQSKKAPERTPWLACPTGPVSQPTEMLIHFAIQRELPQGNSLPIAIALQEGLLLANSHPDLAERIKKDAYAWLQLALDIDEQLKARRLKPISQLPISAQLAWACRYDGRQVLNTVEEYEFHVPTPATIADLRGYAEVRGWLMETTPAELRAAIAKMIKDDFKTFDFPTEKARALGPDFEERRDDAYYVKGKQKYLSYRDVGVNRRWKFLESGFGLKGTRQQAIEFQRVLSIAAALPTLRVSHHGPGSSEMYTVSFDTKKRKWFAAGAPTLSTAQKAKFNFVWHKPWTRPERFELFSRQADAVPDGPFRFLLDADVQEFSVKRLSAMLEKGIADELFAKSILVPLRMRR